MSFDVSGLSNYTDENRGELSAAAVAGAKSAQVLEIQTGYKSSGNINIMDTDVVFQADAAGRTPNGSTTLTARVLTVGAIKIEEDLSPKDLNAKWTQHLLKAGSADDAIPFEEAYVGHKIAKINEAVETAIWQGDTASGNANLAQFDGLLKIIDAEGTVIDGNPDSIAAATGITKANVQGIFDGMYELIPTQVLEQGDAMLMCGFDVFRTYTQSLKDSNLFHYNGEASDFEIMIPATNVKVVALAGLNGTNRLVAGRASNFVVGTDLQNEEEQFEIWYSRDDKVVKFDVTFKLGTQVKFPQEIVEFTLA